MRKPAMKIALLGMLAMLLGACATTGDSPSAMDITEGRSYDLSHYKMVMIDPVTVSFHPNWEPTITGSHLPIGQPERDQVQRDVERFFNETFRQVLGANGAVRIVDQPGPGVLRLTPKLQDVYLNSPAPKVRPGETVYVRSVGELTLNLMFRDAASNKAVLLLEDRVRGREIGLMRSASPVYNKVELERIFEDWAQVIRQDLFAAP